MAPREQQTRTALMRHREDGIIQAIMGEGIEEHVEDAAENIRVCAAFGNGRRLPVLVDFRKLKAQDRGARQYYAGAATAEHICAAALLISSPLSRALGNIFLGLNKPLFPTRLFTSEEEALDWLKGFLG